MLNEVEEEDEDEEEEKEETNLLKGRLFTHGCSCVSSTRPESSSAGTCSGRQNKWE